MMQMDSNARDGYVYDPRIMMHENRYSAQTIEPFTGAEKPTQKVEATEYDNQVTGSHSDSNIVQVAPKTVPVKRYIIIDTSQRDWLKQPNPYTGLIFSFGKQSGQATNPPIYENNPFVPTTAIEQSNLPAPLPGLPNTQGWTLAGSPSNTSYPAYNSSLPKGNFIGYDLGYLIKPSGSGFGSIFTPCNVQSVRLVRAVLPQRQFLSIPIVPLNSGGTNIADASDSLVIQSNIGNKPYSTFSTYPYLLLYLNEYFGQYVGGNEPMRRSFSVMTQKQRTQTDFQISVGVQQYDYEPWGLEALHFQSPITNLQQVQVSITDPIGTPFSQNDALSISLIQATSNGLFLKCFTGSYQYFSGNEMRIGDRVSFYSNTIIDMLKSPILTAMNPQKKQFIESIQNLTFPVLELLDYVPDVNGVYNPRTTAQQRTNPYISSYNGFLIPNFISSNSVGDVTTLYPNSIDPTTYTVLEPNSLAGSNLPFLNTSLQPVYTLELDILQPDTSQIGGAIVL